MEYLKAFLMAICGGAATLFIGALVKLFHDNPKKEKEEREAIRNAILCLLRSDIVWRCRSLLSKGSASLEDKAIISNEFDAYKKMGGDGFIDKLVPDAMNLERSKEDDILKKEV